MTYKTWNGAQASLTAADWTPGGDLTVDDIGLIAVGTVIVDGLALDNYRLILVENGSGVAPVLSLDNATLGSSFSIAARQSSAQVGHAPTSATLEIGGVVSDAGQIVVGTGIRPATLTINELAPPTSPSTPGILESAGVIQANPGSVLVIQGQGYAPEISVGGSLVADGGAVQVTTDMAGTGTVVVESSASHGGLITFDGIVCNTITLLMHGGTIVLNDPERFLAPIRDWDSGTVLQIHGFNAQSLDLFGQKLFVESGPPGATTSAPPANVDGFFTIAGQYTASDFHLGHLADGTAVITTSHVGRWS